MGRCSCNQTLAVSKDNEACPVVGIRRGWDAPAMSGVRMNMDSAAAIRTGIGIPMATDTQALRGLEHEIDMYRVERKLDLSIRVLSQHACGKQGVHVAMNRLYVPP